MSEIKKDKICKQCGKVYHSYQKTSQYCSYSCSVLAHTKYKNTTVACGCCGSLFIVKWKGHKYCSDKCQRASRRRSHKYTCQCCGEEYTAKTVDRNKYCSRECAYKHKTELFKAKPQKVLILSNKTCVCCGKIYRKKNSQKYCSVECRIDYTEKQRVFKAKSQKQVKQVMCACGVLFSAEYRNKRRVFCSDICAKHYTRRITHHTRSARKRSLDATLTRLQWEKIIKKFNNRCVYCGRKSNSKLHQDHFIPISKGGEYTINNIVPACSGCNVSKSNKLFSDWYPSYKYYSKLLEMLLLKHLNYNNFEGIQQLTLNI